jgi:hypothetical protein
MPPKKIKLYQLVSLLTMVIVIISCNNPTKGWRIVKLGKYLISVPASFRYKYQRGIDSEGGEITNDTITLFTDYGYYTDTLFQTPQEYLDKHYFVSDAQSKFEKPGIEYDKNNAPKVEVLTIRPATMQESDKIGFFSGADYIAVCSHEGKPFNWPIKLPADVKNHIVKNDTFNNIYRKVALPKKGYPGETAIYMCRKEDFDQDRQSYYAIAISARSLTEKQQALTQKIFLTLRPKTK